MVNSRFLYPEAIQQESIDIPRKIHNYLKARPIKFQGNKNVKHIHLPLPKKGSKKSLVAITYGSVEGVNPTKVPRKFYNEDELIRTVEEYPFQNVNGEDQRNADFVAVAAIKKIRGPGRYSIKRKEYMINTSTVPIRVHFLKNEKKQRNPIYIKRPDMTRLMGKWLYDIVGGHPRRAYMFNRAIFIEDAVPGKTVSKLDEKELMKKKSYRDGLVRASVHASFLDIPDILNTRNRIVSSNFDTLLFDFNLMLLGRMVDAKGNAISNLLLSSYQEKYGERYRDLMTPNVDDLVIDEMKKVTRRVKANEDQFFGMVRLMEDVSDATQFTYRQKAQLKYNSDSLENLFRKKLAFW